MNSRNQWRQEAGAGTLYSLNDWRQGGQVTLARCSATNSRHRSSPSLFLNIAEQHRHQRGRRKVQSAERFRCIDAFRASRI